MKKIALTVFAIAASPAFAQTSLESATDTLTRPSGDLAPEQVQAVTKVLDESTKKAHAVTVYGIAQGDLNISDSQRKNVPDFSGAKVRVGVNVDADHATAQVAVGFDQGDDKAELRQAQINFSTARSGQLNQKRDSGDIYDRNVSYGQFSLGGIRVGGATAIAPDAASVPTNYGRQDGIYAMGVTNFHERVHFEFGVGLVNDVVMPDLYLVPTSSYNGWNEIPEMIQQSWVETSSNNDYAYGGHVRAGLVQGNHHFDLAGYYFIQHDRTVAKDPTTDQITYARDVTHGEASFVYNNPTIFGQSAALSGNGVSVWYEADRAYGDRPATGSSVGGETPLGTVLDNSIHAQLFGVGFGGDTAPYNHLTNMIQRGDRLTYAAAYTYTAFGMDAGAQSDPYTNFTTVFDMEPFNVNEFSASIGYAVATFEVALNVVSSMSNKDIFYNSSQDDLKDNQMKSYLTAFYAF